MNINNAIPVSEAVIFGFTIEGFVENFNLFQKNSDPAQCPVNTTRQSIAGDPQQKTGIREIEQEQWERYGFEVTEREGVSVVYQAADYTAAAHKKQLERQRSLEEADVDTVGQVKSEIAALKEQLLAMEAKSDQNTQAMLKADAKAEADDTKADKALLEPANIAPQDG